MGGEAKARRVIQDQWRQKQGWLLEAPTSRGLSGQSVGWLATSAGKAALNDNKKESEDALEAAKKARVKKDKVTSPCEHQEDRTEPAAHSWGSWPPPMASAPPTGYHAVCQTGVRGSAFPVPQASSSHSLAPWAVQDVQVEGSRAGERLGAGEGRQYPGC